MLAHFKERPLKGIVFTLPGRSESMANVGEFDKDGQTHRTRGVGARQQLTTKTMSNNSQLSSANRKELADLLDRHSSLRSKARTKWQEKRTQLHERVIEEFAKKLGADKLVPHIKTAEAHLEELRSRLTSLGLCLGSDGLYIHDEADDLDAMLRDRVRKELGSVDDIDARFDSIQLALMTVATLEDAQKLLKSVSEV